MKSNFEFLKEYWPALTQIGETAENYLYSDPNAQGLLQTPERKPNGYRVYTDVHIKQFELAKKSTGRHGTEGPADENTGSWRSLFPGHNAE